ncbi:hypothetical protein ILUMI_07862 [Ignelater luminosus]|uniref:Uncharacterized protein n=1 Tax=Ignelater luminosus TaxID=2038154 RepID=A0A8K0GFY2_IGNLU|nr:hypothetical protein ILUMI_07862 [Ignelater luminosus]
MKTQLIVIFVLFSVGCRQCSANTIAAAIDPLSILRSDPSALLLPPRPNVEISPFLTQPDTAVVDVAWELPAIAVSRPNILRRFVDGAKKSAAAVATVAKKILSIPLSVIKILLLPITVTYNVIKFFVKVFFLPLTIGWKVFKMLLYPIKIILQKLLSPIPDPPPPKFVYGVPTGSQLYGPPIFAP